MGGLGVLGLAGVVLVALLNAVLDLGAPWGYVVFVCFVLVGYATFLRVVQLVGSEFPRHDLEVGSPWYGDFHDPFVGEDVRIVFVPVRYTNREPGRRVSLRFDLLWRRDAGGQLNGPYRVSHSQRKSLESVLPIPLHVEPERTAAGELAFEPHESWVFEYGGLLEVGVKDDYRLSLLVTDYVSGRTLERHLEVREHPHP